ncbi:Eukaryotic translation initiation factor 4 gamma [Grifola frondosa]|uniref:Eukaryotic translation initiation factor 4 gamma n=1 Tax=Grifola frondosa TaxID=5627 RepID=A0A1C7LKW2_GRIFR|nr:Eukaryotic translation initiation factor 4 gamma [Grifola frondosa]
MGGMPMSPRAQPPQLHPPGTPTLTPTIPSPGHPPHTMPSPHTHTTSLSSVSSPPSTPLSTTAPGGGLGRLNSSASTFVPWKVTIKDGSGLEVDLERFKKAGPVVSPPVIVPSSPARKTVVRMETPEAKAKRLAEENEKERLKKAAEETARRAAEEEEKKKQEERLAKEAAQKAEELKALAAEEGEVEEAPEAEEAADDAAKEEAKDKVSDKGPLRIDTAAHSETPKRRPGPLDLSGTKVPIPAPLPSALATARVIEDLGSIAYPEGIKSPKVELNVNAKQGKFRYDREFLLQFMAICKEKPDSLPPLDAIGLEPADQNFAMSRGGSGRRTSSASMPPPASTAAHQASIGLGISGFPKPPNPFNMMGQFSTPSSKMSSEERFQMSNCSTSMSGGPAGMPFSRPSPMVRSSSQGGPCGHPMGSGWTRSQRGGRRDKENIVGAGPSGQSSFASGSSLPGGLSLEPVAPLEASANRWQAGSLGRKAQAPDADSPEVVDRKVRGLLNKLTMEHFDSISDQIITWANRSEKEKDGRTLIQVIRLVFEKATDEATWSEMYARLCRKMMEQISANVQDDGIKNSGGKPIAGGQLFRKYLLNRCQEDFERGWVAKEATAAAAATKATQDQAAKAAAEESKDGESALYSEEYYAAQKAKRQGLGLIKFIGELFKLQMLTERIMHECVKKLLGNVENPEEEEIESLCKLLTTVGQILDTPKARAHMDVYFSRMKELCKSPNVNSRMQFMLQDIIELREHKWVPRNQVAAPTTITAVHEAAAKEKAATEKDAYQRNLSMSRGGSRRGGERGEHGQTGPDGWATIGSSAPRLPPKVGDLSNFGKISKMASMTFGPSSIFAGKKETKRESRGSMNMFSMLSQNPELAVEPAALSKTSRPPSRKASIDLGQSGVPEAPAQRRKLNLLPRTVPKSDEAKADATPAASTVNSDDEDSEAPTSLMTQAEVEA